jgi:hypothetical protein
VTSFRKAQAEVVSKETQAYADAHADNALGVLIGVLRGDIPGFMTRKCVNNDYRVATYMLWCLGHNLAVAGYMANAHDFGYNCGLDKGYSEGYDDGYRRGYEEVSF